MPNSEKLQNYFEMLRAYNKKLNLFSSQEENLLWDKQIVDSLAIEKILDSKAGQKLLDLGSGGGLPGIPIAINHRELEVMLLDATEKKVKALQDICEKLQVCNCQSICGRIEELGHHSDFREKFDFATAKALAPLNVLTEYALPFLKTGGLLYAYKGPNYQEEITASQNALTIMGAKVNEIYRYELNDNLGSRAIVIIEKTTATKDKYPRRVGVPSKRPL